MSKVRICVGVDPGQKGGIGYTSKDRSIYAAIRFPEDIPNAAEFIREVYMEFDIQLAVVEKVNAMPGQGVSSTFKFGTNYGAYLGIFAALQIPFHMVTPRTWQKKMLDSGTGQTKDRSLNYARRLFPSVDMKYKADDGKADALHLARYGWII